MKPAYGLHWFRRDLRIVGNPALLANLRIHPTRILGVYCLDEAQMSREDFSPARLLHTLDTVADLQASMRARGGDLLVLSGAPLNAFPRLIQELSQSPWGSPSSLSFNRDYEPEVHRRDDQLIDLLSGLAYPGLRTLELYSERDHLMIEPHELLKEDATAYRMYSPFRKRWLALLNGADESVDVPLRIREAEEGLKEGEPEFTLRALPELANRGDHELETVREKLRKEVKHPLPEAGFGAAMRRVEEFKASGLSDYLRLRDFPAEPGTSRLSIHLRNGTLTTAQIIARLKLQTGNRDPRGESETFAPGPMKFLEELIWREFYIHLLHHHSGLAEAPFSPKHQRLRWENDPARFQAWCEGRTGFPIVDAGMRQMNRTGWMHNRLRMITASFLVKDLLIDYRWGERYFMQKLLDGDLALNNGGWQWAASTGADAQPYFRVFNPVSQGEKFDPEGKFIGRWAPEYVHGRTHLHAPMNPMVDHAVQREKAIAMFRELRD